MSDEPRILRPRPQRAFNLTPESSGAATPAEPANPDLLNPNGSSNMSRNGSIMNLTSSTLFGIYSPTAFDSSRDESSPWGTEAHTPSAEHPRPEFNMEGPDRFTLKRTRSRLNHGMFRGVILPRALRGVLLFAFGIAYGVITVHLHENHWITPVKLENLHYYESWQYLGFWGLTGITLGTVLPWLDVFSEGIVLDTVKKTKHARPSSPRDNEPQTPTWVAAVRSVGAFVGIAFAMVSFRHFSLLCFLYSLTIYFVATTSMGIHHASLINTRPRKPGIMVPHRPHQDRILAVNDRRIGWDGYHFGT